MQIDLELYLNDSNMFLFGTPDTTTSANKKIPTLGENDLFVILWMKKVTLNTSVYSRLQKERTLSKTKKVRYPVVRSEIRTYSFDGNNTRWSQDNVFLNKVPSKVIIRLLNSTNYNGSLKNYPYAYGKFGVTCVRQQMEGKEYPYRALEPTSNSSAEDLVGYERHYALLFLKAKARNASSQDFLAQWQSHNLVSNDRRVGEKIQRLIKKELTRSDYQQSNVSCSAFCYCSQ